MERKKIAAANWKMNTTVEEGIALFKDLMALELDARTEVVICPPSTHIYSLSKMPCGKNVFLGAQNMYPKEKGAYTGELSPTMIQSSGATYVIIGHSERREYFNESNVFLAEKLRLALNYGLTPIFCCGEGLDIRTSGNHVAHIITQLKESFDEFSNEDLGKVVIAYEPIWAIGTGETASPQQAQEMHKAIRDYLAQLVGEEIANGIPILYGGSVKPANASEIFGQEDVDGGLVGGASLDARSFSQIINSFSS